MIGSSAMGKSGVSEFRDFRMDLIRTTGNIEPLKQMQSADRKTEARKFLVRGRVQGVGFRWFVEREAHMLGVAGWVRNNSDGSVEVLAIGTHDQLSGLRSRLRQGPRASRVDDVEESESKPIEGLKTFRIEGAW
jgi:acylphosphatase